MRARIVASCVAFLTWTGCSSGSSPNDVASESDTTGSSTTGPGTSSETTRASTDGGTSSSQGSTSRDESSETRDESSETASSSEDGSTGGTAGGGEGLGVISGDCGLIDALELESPAPFTFVNAIDFGELGFDEDQLTPGGQVILEAGNLGGSSLHSEIVAYEVLARCDGASLLATEAAIAYVDPMGTKTDLLVEIGGLTVGVSVTRAVAFPFEDPYSEAQAATLLEGKLTDILASTANVAPEDAWVKQILHVVAYADMHAASILAAYATLPTEVTVDTLLVVTVTNGDDAFVY